MVFTLTINNFSEGACRRHFCSFYSKTEEPIGSFFLGNIIYPIIIATTVGRNHANPALPSGINDKSILGIILKIPNTNEV